MSVVITAYEVPADQSVDVESRPGCAHRLHRALDDAARFGYIDVAACTSEDAALDAVRSATSGSSPALCGRYDVFHANDRPAAAFATDNGDETLTFINCLQCEPGQEEAAFAKWKTVNDYMVAQPGYISHTLHRRAHDDAPFAFVNVVEWESSEAWAAAHDEGFRALTAPPLPFVPIPTLCRPVDDLVAP